MKDLVLIGGGGHCKAVIDVVEMTGEWRIAGIVERPGSPIREVMGYPVIGYDDKLQALAERFPYALVTVGQIKSPDIRERLFTSALQSGFEMATIVSPLARVARSAVVKAGTVVMHFALVGPDAQIGVNTIINTRALVEHDAVVGDHCHIATTAVLNGNVIVGDYCMIGSGSICREGISIGDRCLVGMGTVVRKLVPQGTLFVGEKSQ